MKNARVVLATAGVGFAEPLGQAITALGAKLAVVDDLFNAQAVSGDGDNRSLATRLRVQQKFDNAKQALGEIDLVVVAVTNPLALQTRRLAEFTLSEFESACDNTLRATLYVLQACYATMQDTGGSIVVLGPAMSLVGSSELVPLITATEGQRSLVKTAARQWGGRGIRINWLAIADALFDTQLRGRAPEVPELGPPPCALGAAPSLATICPLLLFLASPAGEAITGATLNLDGGEWMVP